METIFDHNPTDNDLMEIFDTIDKNEIDAICRKNPFKLIGAIALLYLSRGDHETAERYVDKIADPGRRLDLKRILFYPDVVKEL